MTLWIDQPQALARHLQDPPNRVGLDTEFVRERTYWPQLALVQIALDDAILLVDPLVPGMCEVLATLLDDAAVLKIMHSASEDLVAFRHACGTVPKPLFDTQIAASLSGLAVGMGYQKLVQELTGSVLPKGETRSDWLRRPLSDAQLEYAADDVRHLHVLHDTLQQRLVAQQREAWVLDDAHRLAESVRADAPEPWPHLGLRASQFLDARTQARLLRLLRWRDGQARRSDRPRSWILDNELALQLAREAPASEAALKKLLDRSPKAPRTLLGSLWAALATPLDDEAGMPLARNSEADRRQLRRLQHSAAALGKELGLPDGVLASRRWLEQLLLWPDKWPAGLEGWRKPLLQARLTRLLHQADSAEPADV